MFHPSKSRNKGTLVDSADLVPGEVADDTMEVDQTDSDDSDYDWLDEMDGSKKDMETSQVSNIAMERREIFRDTKGIADWPPDSHDLNLVNALQSVLHQLFNFIVWVVGFSDEPELQHKVNIPHGQCCKVAQYAKT